MEFCPRAHPILWATEKGHATHSLIYCLSCGLPWRGQQSLPLCHAWPGQVVHLVSFRFDAAHGQGLLSPNKHFGLMLKAWLALPSPCDFFMLCLGPKFQVRTFTFCPTEITDFGPQVSRTTRASLITQKHFHHFFHSICPHSPWDVKEERDGSLHWFSLLRAEFRLWSHFRYRVGPHACSCFSGSCQFTPSSFRDVWHFGDSG